MVIEYLNDIQIAWRIFMSRFQLLKHVFFILFIALHYISRPLPSQLSPLALNPFPQPKRADVILEGYLFLRVISPVKHHVLLRLTSPVKSSCTLECDLISKDTFFNWGCILAYYTIILMRVVSSVKTFLSEDNFE